MLQALLAARLKCTDEIPMLPKKREHPKIKSQLHPRNRHRERYDFKTLIASCYELARYVRLNEYGDESIDFFDPQAVKMLNKSILMHFYGIQYWDIPQNYLCPPIPGRVDYIHYVADLLAGCNNGKIPSGSGLTCLDIGVGANCVYPIIGNREYGWSFIGSEIDKVAIQSANTIIELNPHLKNKVEIRVQPDPKNIFRGIIHENERIDVSICNPPFHSSQAEAQAGNLRKISNLKRNSKTEPSLNFGGQNNELWTQGGEEKFVRDMVTQSREFAVSCFWFTSLISKEANLRGVYQALRQAKALEVKTIPMGQGNKISRIVAWTFLTPEEQAIWVAKRWNTM